MEIFSGALFGNFLGSRGIGRTWEDSFLGPCLAVGLRYSGLEHVANQAIEAKVTWTAEPAIVQATERWIKES